MLKRLKGDLEKNGLRQDKKRKRNQDGNQSQRDHERRVLSSIREAFSPFDVKTTRHKSAAVNVEGARGRPESSKQSSEQERRRAYQAEKRLKGRVGGVLDRRFGERDNTMSAEDKMVARYAREKLLRTQKAARFNLEDEGELPEDLTLTHGGQALSFEDDFQKDLGDEVDEMDHSSPNRQRTDGQEVLPDQVPERKKTKAEVMQEVIAKSKMHKAARQQAKLEDQDRIDELNEDFDSLMNDLREAEQTGLPETPNVQDDYDQNVREMAFDRRAQPGDRTKTEEELQKEAEEKRRRLIDERQHRMENDELPGGEGDDAEFFGLHDEPTENPDVSDDEVHVRDSDDSASDTSSAKELDVVAPTTYKELKLMLGNQNQVKILKNLLNSLDPSKRAGNKEKRGTLVVLTAKYATKCPSEQFHEILGLLRQYAPEFEIQLGRTFRSALIRMYPKPELGRSDFVLLALVSALFSTSDQWHPVVNIAQLLIAKRLSSNVNITDCGACLAMCDLLLLYQRIARRYVPEVSAYLLRVLSAVSDTKISARYVRPLDQSVAVSERFGLTSIENSVIGSSLSPDQATLRAASLVDRSSSLWRSLPSFIEIFEPLLLCLQNLPRNDIIADIIERLQRVLTLKKKERQPLRLQENEPVALRTKIPLFEDNFNPENKAHTKDPTQRELQKLRAQYKKERKGTIREIRRDAEFEARQRLGETRDEKAKYHDMLRKVTSQINSEEGAEKNAYEREKKRRR